MAIDLYSRNVDVAKYQTDVLEISDEVSHLVLQIENLLFTRKKEVLGMQDYGIDLEDLLFTLQSNEGEIRSAIVSQINDYCPLSSGYVVDVNVSFLRGQIRDIAIVDITVDNRKALSIML